MQKHSILVNEKIVNLFNENIDSSSIIICDRSINNSNVGDKLVLISKHDTTSYINGTITSIKLFESFKQLYEFLISHNSNIIETERYLDYYKNMYKSDEVSKNKLALIRFELNQKSIINSRILLDTNIIIYRESHLTVNFEVSSLYRMFDKLRVTKLIHPATKNEISHFKDEALRDSIISKLNSYEELVPTPENDNFFDSIIKNYPINPSSSIDNLLLKQLYFGYTDFLVTDDKEMLRKSRDLFISDRVFSVGSMLKHISDLYPKLIDYDMLSVRVKKFGEVNHKDEFFDTLRDDYPGFDDWFIKKNNEEAYVFEHEDSILGFLFLKVEDQSENYRDIEPLFLPKRRLKVGTFKIQRSGFRLGERFIKIIFDNAKRANVQEIYVTMFENNRDEVKRLREFMQTWGFKLHGVKKSNGELVLVKKMKEYDHNYDPKYNFPNISPNADHYFLPILPEYHTDLFPDSILKNENMNLYRDNLAHRYSLVKIYITSAFNIHAKPGDLLLIYRLGDRYPKRYTSVISGIAILNAIFRPKNIEDYLKLCSNKSVFTEEKLTDFFENRQWNTVIELIYLRPLKSKIILNNLYEWGIIEENKGPRPFTYIDKEAFLKINQRS